jgi:excinuclease UvrABC nuclease subunit
MPARQLHLFAPPKPLVQRLGEAFFRATPREPGVYIMTGRNGMVLYIGQSRNLRQRLASYKNARPDRAPCKVIRLVHAVESITWEKCDSPEGARLRENELLRLHRPKFNRLNTWPQAYSFIRLKYDEAALELSQTREATTAGRLYGAFKAHVTAGYGALLRLTWAAWHQPASPHDFPAQLLASRPPRQYQFNWHPHPVPWSPDTFLRSVQDFLAGVSDGLLQLLTEAVPARDDLSPFQRALQTRDLEVLSQFYVSGPKRNHELTRRHNLPNPLIFQEQLDDLLVENS